MRKWAVKTPGAVGQTKSARKIRQALHLEDLESRTLFSVSTAVLNSWFVSGQGEYSQVISGVNGGTTIGPSTTWSGQTTAVIGDVQKVSYSNSGNYVYVNTPDLASYTMGPWWSDSTKQHPFMNYPSNQNSIFRVALNTTYPSATHATAGGGPVGIAVNGVVFYNNGDAFSYVHSSGADVGMTGDGIWNREAEYAESATFDEGNGHQPGNGQYHYHTDPPALRAQLNDNIDYVGTTDVFPYDSAAYLLTHGDDASEDFVDHTTNLHHSPIIGWMFDGYPIYGPYGYSDPTDPTSPVVRMQSSFSLRTDLTTGSPRISVPGWSAALDSAKLGATAAATAPDAFYTMTTAQQSSYAGPTVSSTYPLGRYGEDYAYVPGSGNLDQFNGRWCVTPEFSNGTYAYFDTIDSTGAAAFPYILGRQYYGSSMSSGKVTSITESVTTAFDVSTNTAPVVSGPLAVSVGRSAALSFTAGNLITVSDVDAAASESVTVTATAGTVNVNLSSGLASGATISAGANNSSTLTLSGNIVLLNAALATLTYTAPGSGTTATLTVRANDGSASNNLSNTLTTTVTITNAAPVMSGPASGSVAHNGTLAFTGTGNVFSVADSDSTNETITLSVTAGVLNVTVGGTTVTGNRSGSLSIAGTLAAVNTALGTLTYTAPGAGASVTLTTQANDGSGSNNLSNTITTTITVTNGAPTDIALSASMIAENQPTGTTVGTFSTTDPDSTTFTYTLASGTGSGDNAAFVISGNTLQTAAVFDYETKKTYSIRVRSTDQGGLFTEKIFTITVTDVNDAPTDVTLSPAVILENQPTRTTVGALSTADPDVGDTFTYGFVSGVGGDDNGSFTLSGNTIQTAAVFDYSVKNSYSIRIRATDSGGLSVDKVVTINVANINDPPTDISLSNNTTAENQPAGTGVGTFSTTDHDTGDMFTYSLVSGVGGEDNGQFTINGNTLQTAAVFDYEAVKTYSILVRSTDVGGLHTEKQFTINVSNVNDAPTDIGLSAASVAENQPAGTAVGSLTTSDQDAGETFTYLLVDGQGLNDNGDFTINGDTLQTAAKFDYETKKSYTVRVRSTDSGGLSFEKDLTIAVSDVNEAPTITGGLYSFFYQTGLPDNTVLGAVTATDVDAGDTKTFSIVNGDPLIFAIQPTTGEISLPGASMISGTYNLTVRVTDSGGLFDETNVFISKNDRPVVTTPIPDQSKNEDAAPFTLDLTDFFADTETLPANLRFGVDSNSATGIVSSSLVGSMLTLTPLADQFGTATFVVRVTDEAGLSVTDTFNVVVASVNDQPTLADIANPAAILEDAPEQTVTLSGVSPGLPANESGQALSVTAVSSNTSLIAAVTATQANGIWSLNYTPLPDANGSTVITVTVKDDGTTDNGGVDTIQKTFTVNVTPVNDRPVIDTEPGIIVEIIPAKAKVFDGSPVSGLTAHVTDVDAGAVKGIAIVSAFSSSSTGQWQFSTNSGVNWTDITGTGNASALLLADIPANRVRFKPNATFTGFASLSYKPWDMTTDTATTGMTPSFGNTLLGTAYGTATEKASVSVGKTTPAIGLDGNPRFTTISENSTSPAGDQAKILLGQLANDMDKKNVLGLAVTDVDDTHGKWQWQSAGKWTDITGVSDSAALLLGPTTKVRFLPNTGFFGTASLGYRVWDQSVGKIGERAVMAVGTAFSAVKDTAEVSVIARPVLDISPERKLVSSVLVGNLLTGAVTDTGADSVGIAITGLTGKGTWSYEIAGGGAVPITKATLASALLLPPEAMLTFVPAVTGFAGAPVSYKAWNIATLPGHAGDRANASGMAFSFMTETLAVDGPTLGNTAPAIGNTAVNLGTITEDPKTNAGITVKSIITAAKITDANKTDRKGTALTDADDANGTWQYSLDGKNWLAVGTVTAGNALALADTARLRYVPAANFHGSATITFHAWDETTGTSGDYLDSTIGTAFSADEGTATQVVSSVNDSPILDTAGIKFLPLIPSGGMSNTVTVATLVAGTTDADTPVNEIGIAITAASGPGQWKYSTDGSSFNSLPKFPAYLPPTTLLRFDGDSGKKGLASLTYQAWDGTSTKADSLSTGKETLTVEVGNEAPTLTVPGVFPSITEDPKTNLGYAVSKLLGTNFQDTAVGKKGIAVTGVDTGAIGEWQYTLNAGKTWTAITGVSDSTALLLTDTMKIRFSPGKDQFSTAGSEPKITYKGWDQTAGASGEVADTTDAGLNAFSAAVTSKITVTSVFDAPTLDIGKLQSVAGTTTGVAALLAGAVSSPESTSFGIAVTGLTGKGTWQADTGSGFVNIGKVSATAAVLLPSTATLMFVPAAGSAAQVATLSYKAWDSQNGNLAGLVSTIAKDTKNYFSTAVETLSVAIGNNRPSLGKF
ncbi:cadherin domain-containing protein [Zavarzinella formosa]|uniref:cadherin domain-containing protein n=1 Tax=Zavarzinella formosa TaxID=360055 RepID=UPI0002EE992A|nr:cadherin domain-containing protein [Zavarzinella formosa]